MNNFNTTHIVNGSVHGEKVECSFKAKKLYSPADLNQKILYVLIFNLATINIAKDYLVPLIKGQSISVMVNNVDKTVTLSTLTVDDYNLIFFFLLPIFALYFLINTLLKYFKSGPVFAITPEKLYVLLGKKINFYNWYEFTGNIEREDHSNYSDIILELNQKKQIKVSKHRTKLVNKTIDMISVENGDKIYEILKNKIKS